MNRDASKCVSNTQKAGNADMDLRYFLPVLFVKNLAIWVSFEYEHYRKVFTSKRKFKNHCWNSISVLYAWKSIKIRLTPFEAELITLPLGCFLPFHGSEKNSVFSDLTMLKISLKKGMWIVNTYDFAKVPFNWKQEVIGPKAIY